MQRTNEKQNDLLKLFWVFALLLFIAIGFAAHAATNKTESALLVAPNLYGKNFFSILINSPDPREAPKNYRKFEGFSTSGVFSKGQTDFLLANATKVEVIDTSAHAHGFVNNMQILWLDQNIQFGTEDHSFVDSEKNLLESLKKEKKLSLYTLPESVQSFNFEAADLQTHGGQKIQVQADAVQTEKQFLQTKKVSYFRVPIATNDLATLEDKRIDQLASALKHLKKDEWLHVHNEDGSKTLGLVLADVLKNAATESLDEILKREDSKIEKTPRLEKIYAYAKAEPEFKISFSKWSTQP